MDRTYICPECGISFSRRYNLQRHIKSYHKRVFEDIDDRNSLRESDESSHQEDSEAIDETSSSQEREVTDESHSSQNSKEDSDSSSLRESSHSERDETDISQSDSEEGSDDSSTEESDNDVFKFLIQDVLLNSVDEFQNLLDHYEDNGSSTKDAVAQAFKALYPHYKKNLKKKFVKYISTMTLMRQTPLFQSILRKMKDFQNDGLDDEEAIKSAVSYRKYSIYNLLKSHIKNLVQIQNQRESDMESDMEYA